MAELVDAHASGACKSNLVRVRVSPSAPFDSSVRGGLAHGKPRHMQSIHQTWRSVGRTVLIAAGLMLVQLLTALFVVQHRTSPSSSYEHLFQFDSKWYEDISAGGYFDHLPADESQWASIQGDAFTKLTNVGFFPGYPLLASYLSNVTGINRMYALLLVAQTACIGCWAYLLLILGQLGISKRLQVCCVVAVLVYPSSFFLISPFLPAIR